ncbi:MAG: hypothetical protein HQM08_10750 [Candidatus Riflebacteria bacterium]|nr:hypothetical protein [Candidatus Riflebacteria bacterium]
MKKNCFLIALFCSSIILGDSIFSPAFAKKVDRKGHVLTSNSSIRPVSSSFLDLPLTVDVTKEVDFRDLLLQLARDWNVSLILGKEARGRVSLSEEQINILKDKKSTVKDFLNVLSETKKLEWIIWKNVLLIGEPLAIKKCISLLNQPNPILQNSGKTINAEFYQTNLNSLAKQLSEFSELNIAVSEGIHNYVTMRLASIPWEQALIGLVYLNGFQMVISDFSVLITP